MTLSLQEGDLLSDQPLILKGHSHNVLCVAFSPSGKVLASGSYDNIIWLWNAETGGSIAVLIGHSSWVRSVAFSPDNATLASGSGDNTIKLWSVRSRAQIATLKGHSSWVYSVAFSPDGRHLASGSGDKTIRLWDVRTRTTTNVLKGHSELARFVEYSPDGERIASGSHDFTIRLWDAASGTCIATSNGHSLAVTSIAFSPAGEHLASASLDKTIQLWDAVTGAQIGKFKGHSKGVTSVAFSPNGKYLASGSYDQTIRLWDVASRTPVFILNAYSDSIYSISFSPDGARLASGSRDKAVRIWNVSLQGAGDPRAASTSDLNGLSESTIISDQDTVVSVSTTFTLNNDITGSVSLVHSERIGLGGFGDVFLGNHKDRGKVALKRPHRLFDEASIRRFLREVDLWCSVSHRYVLPCLGMCKIGLDVYVVSPFIENGDLISCINRGDVLNRHKLLYEVAEALAHLHHRDIIHGDVKAQNILLSDDGSALLCDFGLAKAFDKVATSTESKGAGSVRWMPPELFLGESRSMASDVYSLGITIAEVLSGLTPFHEISENVAVMYHVVHRNGRPPKEPINSPEGRSYSTLWETAEKCWVADVKARPYMAQVLAMLFPLTREMA